MHMKINQIASYKKVKQRNASVSRSCFEEEEEFQTDNILCAILRDIQKMCLENSLNVLV